MSGKRIGIGLLGCGGIASYYHLPVLAAHPGARVVAVADPAETARSRAASLVPGIVAELDAHSVLERADVDAVVVCADTPRHAQLARAAAEAGKHLYLEKPLALTLPDACSVIEAVEAAGVSGTIGFNLRFHPLHRRAHSLLEEGALGQIRAVRAAFHEPARRRRMPAWKRRRATGGGALLDLGSHSVDLLRWHLSTEVADAAASLSSRATEHDCARLRVTTVSGVEADLDCRIGVARTDVFEIVGESGTLRIDRYRGTLSLATETKSLKPFGARMRALVTRPRPEPSFRLALGAWVERLLGEERTLPTLADGFKSLEALLAAERTAG